MSEENKANMEEANKEELEKALLNNSIMNSTDETPSVADDADAIEEVNEFTEEELVNESISVIEMAKDETASEPEKDPVAEEAQAVSKEDSEEEEKEEEHDEVEHDLTEDSEDESVSERHNIPKKDYDSLSKEALIKEFKNLLHNNKVQAIKEHVDEIKAAFNSQFDEEQEEAKEKFLEEGGNIIDFRYFSPLKKEFNSLNFEYRESRNNYYKNLKRDLNANLDTRTALIEELKHLKDELGSVESIQATVDKFKNIQERWRNAGNIPRDRYNLVWNNYHHHVENFYDFLHLNREFRDMDFKHNLDKKLMIIEQAEELTKDNDVQRAFRELQMLHKMWKEEIGPVAKEYRDEIWDKFSAATKKIHEKRQDFFKNIDSIYEENLEKKKEVIAKIEEVVAQPGKSHRAWQQKIKEIETLRDSFFAIGKVPKKDSDAVWKAFKASTRTFNKNKNQFYKDQKKEQYDNLKKKMNLVQAAEDNKDNEDKEMTIELMKKIQAEWKKIGHVPRKDSDRIWKRFKDACNYFFDRIHAEKNEVLEEEKSNLEDKQSLLDKIKAVVLTGDHAADLKSIKAIIKEWKDAGRVPRSQKHIERDFNKVLDGLFKKLDMSKKESELIKYENRVSEIADETDNVQLDKERYFITKKIEELHGEITQLENNLGFFQHVSDENPMVKEVINNISNHKKDLEIWKAKLKKIKALY